MTEKYLSVNGECVTEKIIDKSRFITTSSHVESEEEAREFILRISKKYSDATHNCYAYIPDIQGNFPRFSDDNEPQGTAGMPMLEVLKNKKLVQTAVVVTRYFGGIKLGAGGLLRAYSSSVAENLEKAEIVSFETCSSFKITVDYPLIDTLIRFLSDNGVSILETEYGNGATFSVAVKKAEEENFISRLVNALCGKVSFEKLSEYFYPFKV